MERERETRTANAEQTREIKMVIKQIIKAAIDAKDSIFATEGTDCISLGEDCAITAY
jgi:hypothetical protein